MTRSASMMLDFAVNVNALLVIGSILWLNEAASAAEEGRSDRADMARVFITFFPVYAVELLARALAGVPGK